jgi:hypothetical protein
MVMKKITSRTVAGSFLILKNLPGCTRVVGVRQTQHNGTNRKVALNENSGMPAAAGFADNVLENAGILCGRGL